MEHEHEHDTQKATIDPFLLNSLEWRSIGPYRGGRVVAVAGDPANTQVFYFGSTGGGVWKTTDGGLYWENVSDGFFKRASVGALAVSASDPNVIYVGMGETCIRGNVSHGDGVYKSTDGGKTWMHLGLADTRHIAKVRIHPQNPDLVYVAALGHAYGANPERGVYRSQDGGKTWQHILFRSDKAGAIDLAMDPNNPRILYAAFWEAQRMPHTLISGGEGSDLFKSNDGGDTWTDLRSLRNSSQADRNSGLPKGVLGKIGIAVSPAKADRVWAIIEADDGAVFRSDDGGQTWQRLCEERDLRQRAWYYQHIYADPQDAETVWVLDVQAWKSIDGGRTFFDVAIPHGDNHDLWIDPHSPRRMIEGNDGGACITFNGGESWSSIYNQPTAEFYHVTTDNQVPYHVYGAQQDNSTIGVASRSSMAGITESDWYEVGGGESGYVAVRSDDPNIVYTGNYQGYIGRYDHRSRQVRNIAVWPELASGWGAKDQKYRFQWTFPILLSPHDPNILYITGNYVFCSMDEGNSWEIISPDLTRDDVSKMEPSGGPIAKDNTGAEYYGTIFTFAESPIKRGLFWAGSDDGLVHISQDEGQTWQNITPSELPEWALISIIEPSPHDPATAYMAATRYKLDDFQPYLFKTNDYGQSWTNITNGIRGESHDESGTYARVIREDPVRRGLLYAGTETGIHVSFDDGEHWQSLRLNLPVVPIHDMVIKDSDLVVATHGRSFWILDDVTPLRQVSEEIQHTSVHLFKPRSTTRFMTSWGFSRSPSSGKFYRNTGGKMVTSLRKQKPNGEPVDYNLDAGQNPPNGVIVTYYFKEKPEDEVKLSFFDAGGEEVRTFSSEPPSTSASPSASASIEEVENGEETIVVAPTEDAPAVQGKEKRKERKEPRVPKEQGANRFVWRMRYAPAKPVDGYVAAESALAGPVAAPGTYEVRLTVGDATYSETFTIDKDPRVAATQADLEEQLALRLKIRDKLSETHDAVNMIRNIRQQVEDWERRTQEREEHESITKLGKSLKEKLSTIENELIQSKAKSRQDTLNFPAKLNAKLAALSGAIASADAAPTRQQYELFEDLVARIDVQLKRLQEVMETDVMPFNKLIRELDVPALVPTTSLFTR